MGELKGPRTSNLPVTNSRMPLNNPASQPMINTGRHVVIAAGKRKTRIMIDAINRPSTVPQNKCRSMIRVTRATALRPWMP